MMVFAPQGIIVHCMGERVIGEDGKDRFAKDHLRLYGLSVHAFIHPSGGIESWIEIYSKAQHVGKFNSRYLGFELLVKGKHNYDSLKKKCNEKGCYPKAQFDAAIELTKRWIKEANIDVSNNNIKDGIKGHQSLNPKKYDPGSAFDWDGFYAGINKG